MNQAKIKNTNEESRLRLPAILLTARSGGLVETTRGRIILFGEICERKKREILDEASISFWDIFVYNETRPLVCRMDPIYLSFFFSLFLYFFFIISSLPRDEISVSEWRGCQRLWYLFSALLPLYVMIMMMMI